MNKSLNLQLQEFKEGLAEYVNESNLPVGIKMMVVNEFSQSLSQVNYMSIEQERMSLKKDGEKNGEKIHTD